MGKCKMSCKLLQMLVILYKMTARMRKMTAAPRKMTAATHLMFAKDQRGGLEEPPRAPGDPPLPLYLKKLKCVAAVILHGAAVSLRSPAVMLCSMTSICSNLHD